jgi:hypothetical protein
MQQRFVRATLFEARLLARWCEWCRYATGSKTDLGPGRVLSHF